MIDIQQCMSTKTDKTMKKVLFFYLCLVMTLSHTSLAQSVTASDFFAGKWELIVKGTPDGDSKLLTTLLRKEGKLTGELADMNNPSAQKIAITKVEESEDEIELFFTAQGYDVSVKLTKVDGDNLRGMLLSMFEARANRIKESK